MSDHLPLTVEAYGEDADSLREMGARLRTQANACTETPAFAVQEFVGLVDDRADDDDNWRTVQTFLTGAAADRYMRSNLHNLRRPKEKQKQPRVYVLGGYRNYERQLLRRVLMALAPPTTPLPWREVLGFGEDVVVNEAALDRRLSWLERDANPLGKAEIEAARDAALTEIARGGR